MALNCIIFFLCLLMSYDRWIHKKSDRDSNVMRLYWFTWAALLRIIRKKKSTFCCLKRINTICCCSYSLLIFLVCWGKWWLLWKLNIWIIYNWMRLFSTFYGDFQSWKFAYEFWCFNYNSHGSMALLNIWFYDLFCFLDHLSGFF